jgi:hypothetical protein
MNRTVRVFISSTFRDMQAERDHLVKFTFPQLRKLCESRGVTWGEVDLRWGITDEETAEGKVLPLCLEEIHRCRPYFIGLLGERYGWIPDNIPGEIIEREAWIREPALQRKSVTELEILHGVLNNAQMANHAFFYFRDPKYIDQLAAGDRQNFLSEDIQSAEKLEKLKERIRQNGFPVRENYPDPKALGDLVLEDFTELIEKLYPAGEEPSPLDRESAEHEAFAQSRVRIYIGRQEYFDRLNDHVQSEGPPLVMLGESGSGKSSLLANWAAKYREHHPEALVIQHYVGATPASADWAAMLRRIMGEFQRRFKIQQEIPEEPNDLRAAFVNWLHMAAAKGKVVLILDGLNQLDHRDGALDLVWLPREIPTGVRLMVSTLPGRSFAELAIRGWPTFTIEPLIVSERKQLIAHYLGYSSKALNDFRTDRIARAEPSSNPLYLRALLDELRVFGVYEHLDQRIQHYLSAQSVAELYDKILERYEQDYEDQRPGLVREAMSLIWVSRRGLSEVELLDLLGKDDGPLPRAHWSPLHLAAESSLVNRSGLLNFSHDYLRQAVKHRYIPNKIEKLSLHLRLADYFELRGSSRRRLDELPWQLNAGEFWERLFNVLSEPFFFAELWEYREYDVMTYWRRLEEHGSFRIQQLFENLRPFIHDQSVSLERLKEVIFQAAELASKLNQPGLAATAYKTLQGLFRETGDLHNLQACLGNEAICHLKLRDPETALTRFQEQEEVARQIDQPSAIVNAICGQASIHAAGGRHEEALRLLNSVESFAIKGVQPLVRAGYLGNRAILLSEFGQFDAAIASRSEAQSILRAEERYDLLLKSFGDAIKAFERQDRLGDALQVAREAVLVARREGDKAALLRFLMLQADVEIKQHNLTAAAQLFEAADPLCRQLNDRRQLVASLVFRAAVFSEIDYRHDRALALAEEGFELAQDLGEETKQSAWTVLSNIRRAKLESPYETQNGAAHMAYPEQAMVQEIFRRLKAAGKQEHVKRLIMAMKHFDDGITAALNSNYEVAVSQHESALRQLNPIEEALALRAMVKARLVAEYGGIGRTEEALASGKEAIEELGKDLRLESTYAECLLNLGAILAHGDPNESLSYLERAKLIYETRADGREALAVCEENMETARSNIARPPKASRSKPGWWSKFTGKN